MNFRLQLKEYSIFIHPTLSLPTVEYLGRKIYVDTTPKSSREPCRPSANMLSSTLTAAQILDRFYAAERIYMSAPLEQRDISGMAACLTPDFKGVQSPDLPWGGVWEGLDGFLEWGKMMSEYFDVLDVQNPRVFEQGGADEVVVLLNLHLRVRKTQEELDHPMVQVAKVDFEKGLIRSFQPFMWNVAGLNEKLAKAKN